MSKPPKRKHDPLIDGPRRSSWPAKGDPSFNSEGRPTIYNDDIRDEICWRLAAGESLRRICRDDHTPELSTVTRWAINPDHPFFIHYHLARKAQAEAMADEIGDIADELHEQNEMTPAEVQLAKLRCDNRKWISSRVLARFKDKFTFEDVSEHQQAPPLQALASMIAIAVAKRNSVEGEFEEIEQE